MKTITHYPLPLKKFLIEATQACNVNPTYYVYDVNSLYNGIIGYWSQGREETIGYLARKGLDNFLIIKLIREFEREFGSC